MKVLANDGISTKAAQLLEDNNIQVINKNIPADQLADYINNENIDVLLVRSATLVRSELMLKCPGLKIVGRGGVGMDNIDVDFAKSKGIHVINTPLASSRSVAEMVFAHFFALARHLHNANRQMPATGSTQFNALKKDFSKAIELTGKTLGVIGFGGIGKEVAKIGIALGMQVKVFTRNPITETLKLSFFDGQEVSFNISSSNDMPAFLTDLDFLSINTPKSDGYILDAVQFDLMKPDIFIVNTARGGVINEKTLSEYLNAGKIAGAALDVFENEPTPSVEILQNPKFSLTPHLGGNTNDAQEKIGIELAEQIINFKNQIA